ncbi:hypothetical protein ACFE04_006587 [Oxalis oulophora]
MEDSGEILCQISYLKEMLDQVNEEIEANIKITREIDSEIVKCSEVESNLDARESELTKTLYLLRFEISGLISVAVHTRNSVKILEEKLDCLRKKQSEMMESMNEKRERFLMLCQEFQRDIEKGRNEELIILMSEKEFLENEIQLLDKKNNSLQNSMLAFVEEILVDLHDSNSALDAEIQNANLENEKLLKDIDDLKTTLHSVNVVYNGKR